MADYFEILKEVVSEDILKKDEKTSLHTSFMIGGPCSVWASPVCEQQIIDLIRTCQEQNIPYIVLGRGSNVLFADEGYDGVIINIGKDFSECTVEGETITAMAGISLSKLANIALSNELAGLEFASGIPGSLGGAIVMNAGAYGGEMKDVVTQVRILKDDLGVETFSTEQMDFSYRHSVLKEIKGIVLSVTMQLHKGKKEEISSQMNELNSKRKEKQPLEFPSAGSTFKRPEGYFAGKLIQDSGLSGFRVGDAEVSEKHNGFVINRGNATALEVKQLISEVQKKVEEQFGVRLEREVIYLPEEA